MAVDKRVVCGIFFVVLSSIVSTIYYTDSAGLILNKMPSFVTPYFEAFQTAPDWKKEEEIDIEVEREKKMTPAQRARLRKRMKRHKSRENDKSNSGHEHKFLTLGNEKNYIGDEELLKELERLVKEYSSQVLDDLKEKEQVDCLPKVCKEENVFYNLPNGAKPPKVYLSSFPGSGNTWIRSIIRTGTKHFTGSVYKDKRLFEGGFLGTLLKAEDPKVGVIKTHYPYWRAKTFPHWFVSGAVYLVRSPFDASLAECQRTISHGHKEAADSDAVFEKCGRFTFSRKEKWLNMMELWTGKSFKDLNVPYSIEMVKLDDRPYGLPTLVLFYEDFLNNFTDTVTYLFAFLKIFYKDLHPSVYDSVICAIHEANVEEAFHRKKHFNIFKGKKKKVEMFCENFEKYWNENKWGTCTNGDLQIERDITKQKRVHVPDELCTE